VTGLSETHDATSITLSWTPPPEADFTGIKLFCTGATTTSYGLGKGLNSWTLTGLTTGTSYQITIKTQDAMSISRGSSIGVYLGTCVEGPLTLTLDGGSLDLQVGSGAISVYSCVGNPAAIVVPSTINGVPVRAIEANAFFNVGNLTSVVLGANIAEVRTGAFANDPALVYLEFSGEPPAPSLWGAGILEGHSANLKIYVPPAYLAQYKANWTEYASYIYPKP
jgi:hypothetical protein